LIPQQQIAAWRAHAPWNDDLMVEQDYLLCKAIEAIFTSPKLKNQLAMRGGTVLHKAHLAPASRYSEDIDLVLTADRSREGIKEDIASVLAPLLGDPAESFQTRVRLSVRNLVAKSEIARLHYVYEPTSMQAATASLKVEVNLNEREPLFPLTTLHIDAPGNGAEVVHVPVVSYDLDEMLGTKLRALIQREHGRDLFDLWRALHPMTDGPGPRAVDPKRVGEAFRFYLRQEGTALSRDEVRDAVARRMRSKKFLSDMRFFLRDGVAYDVRRAHEVFCDVLLPHL
jgi:predicted nucleotidyltransferase component of viral defense system